MSGKLSKVGFSGKAFKPNDMAEFFEISLIETKMRNSKGYVWLLYFSIVLAIIDLVFSFIVYVSHLDRLSSSALMIVFLLLDFFIIGGSFIAFFAKKRFDPRKQTSAIFVWSVEAFFFTAFIVYTIIALPDFGESNIAYPIFIVLIWSILVHEISVLGLLINAERMRRQMLKRNNLIIKHLTKDSLEIQIDKINDKLQIVGI